jgi:TonB family protein
VNSNSCGKGLVVFSLTLIFGLFAVNQLVPQKDEFVNQVEVNGDSTGIILCEITHEFLASQRREKEQEAKLSTLLRIISKPVADYTPIAREKQIQGVVRLRVIFQANGSIGGAFILNGLPDGLNQQALSSAKAIRFVPAKLKGKPITVTKVVEYRFTIY